MADASERSNDRFGDYSPLGFLKDLFAPVARIDPNQGAHGDLLHNMIIGAPGALHDLAKANIEASEAMRGGYGFDPKPAFDTALAMMGTGAVFGPGRHAGEVALTAGGQKVYLPWDEAARIARAHEQGFVTDAYHGTKHQFGEFRHTPPDRYPTIDQALGPHFAKDPQVSNTFTEGYGRPGEYQTGGHVIPVRIPDEAEMLRVAQRRYPETGALETDSRAIANAANVEAWRARPTMLQSWLTKQHAMSPSDVERVAGDLLAGRSVPIRPGADPATLMEHLQNYGSSVGADVHTVADLARRSWQEQGYKGLIYENTAPDEIRNALNRTSYVVFDPTHVRSRFAAFDPANVGRAGLMGSLAGLGASLASRREEQ